MHSWRSRLWRPEVGFFLALWLVLLLALRSRAFNDPGALWHTVVGERILAKGFPHTDEYTFTHAGEHWIPQQWLAEMIMAWLHRLGGFDAMLLAMATLLAALYAWLGGRFLRAGLRWPLALGLACFCMFVSAFHFYLRPHLATIVLLGWSFAWMVDYENGSGSLRRLAWLVPLCVFWTNLHGGVLAGVFTFGLCAGGWGLAWLAGRKSPVDSWRTLRILGAIGLACALAPLVNPFSLDLLRTWWSIVGSSVLPQVVPEHSPLTLARTGDRAVLAFAAFYVAMLLGVSPRRWRVTWLVPLAWFLLTLKGIRQGPLFVITAGVALADLLPQSVWLVLLRRAGESLVRPAGRPDRRGPGGWPALLIPAGAVLAALGLQLARVPVPLVGSGWACFDPRYVPTDLCRALREYARSVPPGTPIFNDSLYGGFLIYHTPRLKVFIDDRCELYSDEWIVEFVRGISQEPWRIDEWAEEYGFERALVPVDSPMDRYLRRSDNWEEVARGRGAVFYAKKRGRGGGQTEPPGPLP